MASRFEYAQAEEIRDAFARHGVRYLFLGKSGLILLGYPDTTQDADLFCDKSLENGAAILRGLQELGFQFSPTEAADVVRGKDFIQIKSGPFDLDLVFAPRTERRCLASGRSASGGCELASEFEFSDEDHDYPDVSSWVALSRAMPTPGTLQPEYVSRACPAAECPEPDSLRDLDCVEVLVFRNRVFA